MQDLLIGGNCDSLRGVDDAIDVTSGHFLVPNGDNSVGVEASHMAARDTRVHRMYVAARHQFGFFDCALNRVHRRLDVDDDTFLQAARRLGPDPNDLDVAVVGDLADDRDNLGRADVEAHYQFFVNALLHIRAPLVMRASRGLAPEGR